MMTTASTIARITRHPRSNRPLLQRSPLRHPVKPVLAGCALLVSCALLGGCRSLPDAVRVDVSTPDKDVIVHHVEVSGPLEPRQYFQLAEHQRQGVVAATTPAEVPIYEFFCSFRTREKLVLATVHYRCSEGASRGDGGSARALEHHETRVYRSEDR